MNTRTRPASTVDQVTQRRRATTPLTATALRDLAKGPGRFGQAVGLRHPIHDGIDAITGEEFEGARAELWLRDEPITDVATGPRGRGRRGRHRGVPLALLDRGRPDGLDVPVGERRSGRVSRPRLRPALRQSLSRRCLLYTSPSPRD